MISYQVEQHEERDDYKTGDLSGINFGYNDLRGGIFASQILTNTDFYSATLNGADFTAAGARGAWSFAPDYLDIATTTNLIRPDGHIHGLDLVAAGLVVIRDYDGRPEYVTAYPPIPIIVDQRMAMGPGGTLRMMFEADAWDSTISFESGIPVTIGGTLELRFADDVNLAGQIGRTFHLFDWSGVAPTGAFNVSSPYRWNIANLYTAGEVTLVAVPEPTALILIALSAVICFQCRSTRNAQLF